MKLSYFKPVGYPLNFLVSSFDIQFLSSLCVGRQCLCGSHHGNLHFLPQGNENRMLVLYKAELNIAFLKIFVAVPSYSKLSFIKFCFI